MKDRLICMKEICTKDRLISILTALICIIVLLGSVIYICAEKDTTLKNQENIPIRTGSASLPGYKKIAETETLELYYNEEIISILVRDKRNGFLWGSSVDGNYYNMEKVNKTWKENMSSLFYIKYTNDYKKVNSTSIVAQESIIRSTPMRNGVSIEYDLTKLGIKLALEIWLDDKSVNIRIPVEKLDEYGNSHITSIELLPFFGAAIDSEEGYIFYPDGSGGLYHFKGKPENMAEKYSWPIYGYDRLDLQEMEKREKEGFKQALLPVFGLKKGNNAFLCIVTKGEPDTNINFYPSGFAVNLNRINAEFYYRRMHRDTRPYATITDYIEKEKIDADHEVKYTFLIDENANYSGMASAYRDYLESSGSIQKVTSNIGNMHLWLDLFMGIKLDQVLFDKYIKMTTFEETEKILDNFKAKGINNIMVNLIGWTKGGYGAFPINWPPERALGGKKGLEKFSEYARNNNIKLYLENNFIDALGKNGGFSKRNDVVYHKNGLSLADRKREKYILNPVIVFERFKERFVPNVKKLPITGLSFDKLGSLVYYDYNKNNPVAREDTIEQWMKMFDESRKEIGSSVVRGGNAYTLKYADWLLDIPMDDSGYFITDESIPFYQMVVHGYIPYSSEPCNLFHDYQRQKLKCIEYGCIPYFKLTYQEPVNLRKTEYNHLFTSYYLHWIDVAVDMYKEFEERLGNLWNEIIVKHEKISDNLYKVTYKDNSIIYVNYNEETVFIDNRSIEGMNYLIVDGEGRER
jgi:hypothetical protein